MKTFVTQLEPGNVFPIATVTGRAALCWIMLIASPSQAQSIVGWGDNSHNQLNIPASATNVIAVAAGNYHNMALRADGTVVGWGGTNTVPAGLNNVVSIAAGGYHSLALRRDGTVVAWGYNAWGQTTVPAAATNVVAIAASDYFSIALRADGTYVPWGGTFYPGTGPIFVGSNVVSIGAASVAAFGLRNNGTVLYLGPVKDRSFSSAPDIVAIAGGYAQDVGVTASGQVVARGSSIPAVSAQATNVIAISARANLNVAITAGGQVLAWGTGAGTNVPTFATNVSAVAAGMSHGVALIATNSAPALLGSIAVRDSASAGDFLPLCGRAVGAQPLSYQWYAGASAIPNNNTPFPQIPAVMGTDNVGYSVVVSNAFGSVTSAVVNITVVAAHAWGLNLSGQTTVPLGATNPVTVAAGAFHCLALNPDGTVLAWGKNSDGQTIVPANATNVTAIAAGGDHSVALRTDGSVLA